MSNLVLWFKHTNFVWNKFGCKEISLRKNNLFCPQGIISMIYKKKGNGIGSGVRWDTLGKYKNFQWNINSIQGNIVYKFQWNIKRNMNVNTNFTEI